MIVTKSYSFYSDNLNDGKFELLKKKAEELRNFRNFISKEVCANFSQFTNMGKYDWINYFRTQLPNCNNQDISHAITDVFVAYQNKIDQFKQQTVIKIQDSIDVTYYKRNTANFRKGDVKAFSLNMKQTKLTKVVTYLVRYYNDGLLKYIEEHVNDDPKKAKLRNDVLHYVDKYKSKLLSLVEKIRDRLVRELTEYPIEFTSLSFSSCNEQVGRILNWNKTKGTEHNAYITLSGQKTENGKLHLPTKHSRKHHGNINDYDCAANKKRLKTISYVICFIEDKIRIVLTKEVIEHQVTDKFNLYGVDVNVKHNLFTGRDGHDIDYDRNIFEDYVSFLKKMDQKLTRKRKDNLNPKLSNADSKVKARWFTRIKDMLKRKANLLVKHAIANGLDHIVMEDLQNMGKMYSRSEEFMGFKYSRLIRLLNLTDLKNIVSSIAQKHGIQVSFVHPHYTSKTCPICGCIDSENRKLQEKFVCIRCGCSALADTHSARNIEDRIGIDVLRRSLLNFSHGLYSPKRMKKEAIKDVLSECYDTRAAL